MHLHLIKIGLICGVLGTTTSSYAQLFGGPNVQERSYRDMIKSQNAALEARPSLVQGVSSTLTLYKTRTFCTDSIVTESLIKNAINYVFQEAEIQLIKSKSKLEFRIFSKRGSGLEGVVKFELESSSKKTLVKIKISDSEFINLPKLDSRLDRLHEANHSQACDGDDENLLKN